MTIAVVMPLVFPHLFLGRSLSSVRLLSLLYLSSCPWCFHTSSSVGRYRRSGYCRHYHHCRHALGLPSPLLSGSLSSVRLLSSCPWCFHTSSSVGCYRRSDYCRHICCRHALGLPLSLPLFRYRRSGYCRHICCRHAFRLPSSLSRWVVIVGQVIVIIITIAVVMPLVFPHLIVVQRETPPWPTG